MRVFVALPLPDEAADALETLQARLPRGRIVPRDNLHLTLAFLGEQPEAAVEAVHEGLMTLRAPPLTVALEGAALYGGARGQALGLEADGDAALHELHDRVRARLRGAGVAPERRRFRPHVTLARLPGGSEPGPVLAPLAGAAVGPFPVTSVALVESVLRPDGAEYTTLAAYPLG